ncbi:MAG: aspartyl protease family protein [Candidatus Solibacter sp.]
MARFRICLLVGFGLLLAPLSGNLRAAEGPVEAPGNFPAPSPLQRARHLLRAGQTTEAGTLVNQALAGVPDDSLLSLSGEIHFRRAEFVQSAADFQGALDLNPANARAWWGLGRIEQLHFRTEAARAYFAKAFLLDHRDTDIILAYANFVSGPAAKTTLLENVALLARYEQPERAEQAAAQRTIHQRLQGRSPARLASPYTTYHLPLTGFRPSTSAQDGLLLAVRIDGGKPLQLLLDTGARGIVLNARAGRNLQLETVVGSQLQGLGDTGASQARVALARTVAFAGLVLEECLLEISDRSLTPGADGVIGADVFERFKIGIDAHAGMLHLTPFDADPSPAAAATPALGIRNLLLVHARIEGGREGLFLVDTGAAYSVISPEYLPPAHCLGNAVEVQGAQGASSAVRLSPLTFNIAGTTFVDRSPVAMDLSAISQIEGVDIAGIIGYSTLGQSPFTLDLRHGAVEFARAATR